MDDPFMTAFALVAKDISQVAGLTLLWKDADAAEWHRWPKRLSQHGNGHCRAVKTDPARMERCVVADALKAEDWQSDDGPRLRRCPFGWQEVAVAIRRAGVYQGCCFVGDWPPDERPPRARALAIGRLVRDAVAAIFHLRGAPIVHDERLVQAKDYIEANLSAELRAAEVVAQLHLSASRFVHWLAEAAGMPYRDWLHRRLMERAAAVLLRGDSTITAIGMHLGYANPPAFTAAFRRHFGCPPRDWLRRLGA
jgi:AraC-like DNA-binding protein